MKKKDKVELSAKSEKELKTLHAKLKEDMSKSVLDKYNMKSKQKNVFGKNKRQIARILTLLRIKEGEEK